MADCDSVQKKADLESWLRESDGTDSPASDRRAPNESARYVEAASAQSNSRRSTLAIVEAPIAEWEYVDDHDNNEMIQCKICTDVLRDPHLITCCGECCCRKCFDRHLQRAAAVGDGEQMCPFCRKANFRLIENSDLKKSVNALKVYCLRRKSGCLWSGRRQDGESHLNECEFYLIDCPNGCGCDRFERRTLGCHMTSCPMQSVGCLFEQVGCSADRNLARRDARVHSEKDIHHHLILLARKNLATYEQCDITLASLRSSFSEMIGEKEELVKLKKQELRSLEQNIESLEVNLFDIQQKIETMKVDDNTNRARCAAELTAKADIARGLHDACQATLTEFQALPVPDSYGILCPPVMFTIDQFSFRKAHDEQWLSPPFYTHCGGYKMCLSVCPNGSQRAQGTHVSIFFHMMSGEFDDDLQWPFPGAIINICAICQRSAVVGSVVGSRGNFGADVSLIGSATAECRSRLYDGSYGPGYGQHLYVPHRILNEYLSGDTFKLMISYIQFFPL